MQAFRLMSWKGKAQLCEVPVPEPGLGEVRIKVGGAGICHTDLHICHHYDESHPLLQGTQLPVTLGHENAGWIDALGPGVVGFEVGEPVIATTAGCGRCRNCLLGWQTYCETGVLESGIGLDGGLAEFYVTPASALVPLGDLEPWKAAPLACAGMTAYHGVKHVLSNLTPDSTVVVIGIGGLGHMAIAILKTHCAAQVIAIDRSPQALELARMQGADIALMTDGDTANAIREHTRGLGAQAVLDFVGANATMKLAAQVARARGQIAIIGLGRGTFEFREFELPYGCSMTLLMGGNRLDLFELVALAEADKVSAHIKTYRLEDIDDVMHKLERGEIVGRAVITPHGQLA